MCAGTDEDAARAFPPISSSSVRSKLGRELSDSSPSSSKRHFFAFGVALDVSAFRFLLGAREEGCGG